jgi:hypothetical protein
MSASTAMVRPGAQMTGFTSITTSSHMTPLEENYDVFATASRRK